ncbi:MAG: CYTH domain-containing protein [Bacteroidota bacterium]
MGVEIERKFLVNKEKWEVIDKPVKMMFWQGYLTIDPEKTIRVRITDSSAYLTIKGISVGATRAEFEYEIPKADAELLLAKFTIADVRKIRYEVIFKHKLWEVDEFLDKNEGLIIAEIELTRESEPFELPDWVEREVTNEEKYYNSNLSVNPYKNW